VIFIQDWGFHFTTTYSAWPLMHPYRTDRCSYNTVGLEFIYLWFIWQRVCG